MKQNNFIERWKKAPQNAGKQKKRGWLRAALPAFIIVGVSLLVLGGVLLNNAMVSSETEKANQWSSDVKNLSDYTESLAKQAEIRAIQSKNLAAKAAWEALGTYPELSSGVFDKITAAGSGTISVTLRSYDAQTGILSFDASSSEAIDIPSYVRKLEATKLFYSVAYSGYGYNSSAKAYTINLNCILAAKGEG